MSANLALAPTGASVEVEHQRLEREAYDAAMAAVSRGDELESIRLWAEYQEIHARRPASLVKRMERDRGLA